MTIAMPVVMPIVRAVAAPIVGFGGLLSFTQLVDVLARDGSTVRTRDESVVAARSV